MVLSIEASNCSQVWKESAGNKTSSFMFLQVAVCVCVVKESRYSLARHALLS